MDINQLIQNPVLLFVLAIWDIVWKGFGLWYASKNNQRNWFIGMLIFNTLGILPMVYLKFFQKKEK